MNAVTVRRARVIGTLGETLALARANESGSLAQIHDLRLGIGGAESNVAIGLARLGVPAAWLGRVGDDPLGRRIVRELRAEQVAVHAIVDSGAPTGFMLKESPTPTTTAVHYYRTGSAGSRLTPADLQELDIESLALLHVTGIPLAISASARKTVLIAVDRAAAAGVPISFDVNHRSRLWTDDSYRDLYRGICQRAAIVFAGEDEAALLVTREAREGPRALAAALSDLGPGSVVLKRGAAGALAFDDGSWFEAAAVPIRPVDTVGAGDAFVAGWLAEWHAGLAPMSRLSTAIRCGALACLHPGDWEGLPFRPDLDLLGHGDPVTR